MYELRDYQQEASNRAISFFQNPTIKGNGLIVLPTGAGKSLVIADIASRLDGHVLVFQPNKEILEQNFNKLCSYDILDCSIFSASCDSKEINRITFATIGSASNQQDLFKHFKYIIVDECHICNPQDGRYKQFFKALGSIKIVGLTATPYRLHSNRFGSELRFLTRTKEKIFNNLLYCVQVSQLSNVGFLSKLDYFIFNYIDSSRLEKNTKRSEYDDVSIRKEYESMNFDRQLLSIVERLLFKSKVPRKGILIFTKFIDESQKLIDALPDGLGVIVTGDTPKKERETILNNFRSGLIKVVANVGVLTTGFDYPALDTIVLARPTMSLSLYYQMVGRAIRPHNEKQSGWIVDLCGNIGRFGRVEELTITSDKPNLWYVRNGRRQLTNVIL